MAAVNALCGCECECIVSWVGLFLLSAPAVEEKPGVRTLPFGCH